MGDMVTYSGSWRLRTSVARQRWMEDQGRSYGMIPAMADHTQPAAPAVPSTPTDVSTPPARQGVASVASSSVPDAAWDAFVCAHAHPHFLQTSAWTHLKCQFGWQSRRVVAWEDGHLAAGASILLRSAAGLTVGYVPRGPVVDWTRHDRVARFLRTVETTAAEAGAALLRLEPELADTPAHRMLLRELGYVPSRRTVQPPSTIVLPIDGDDDAVLGRMKSKWRYNVRLAERKGITVRPLARHELPHFQRLMDETGSRDGFALHSAGYYAAAYDLFTPALGTFLLAEYAGEPLAAIAVVACGPMAWYVWGASSSRERPRMPNHALQWAGIQWARAQGARFYDFWGIPDEIGLLALGMRNGDGGGTPIDEIVVDLENLPGEGLWGVYRFKQGFGGSVVRHVGIWDKPLRRTGYRLFHLGLDLRDTAQQATREARMLLAPAAGTEGLEVVPVQQPVEWRAALGDLPEPHVLQSWEWGLVKQQTGWAAERLVLRDARAGLVAAFQFLTRSPVPGLPLGVGYVPKGPVVDWSDTRRVEQVLAQIEAHARRRRCIFVKIDPDVEEYAAAGIRLRQALRRRGWRFSADQIQFKNTAFSTLGQGEEALLEGMKSKWRYNIRLAERRGIHVRQGNEADLPAFYDLYAETGRRDGFLIRPFAYYQTAWETFLQAASDPGNPAGGVLLLAEHADDRAPLAGILVLRYGARAWYFYGASSERHRRDMPNYLLQWEGMRWAVAQGCAIYDWWGAPTDLDDPEDGMQGVWQFKQGFGAHFRRHVGAWDFPVYPPLYRLYTDVLPRVLANVRRLRQEPG